MDAQRPSFLSHRWLRLLVSVVVLATQAVVVATPLAEARWGVGANDHVEAQNERRHFSHAETNCAFCTAITIHATAARCHEPLELAGAQYACGAAEQSALATPDLQRSHLSRAPPVLALA